MTEATAKTDRVGWGKIWLLNFLGNMAALAVGYYWLLIPDAHGGQVAGSAVLAVSALLLMAWLRTGTFTYFRIAEFRQQGEVGLAFRRGLRHIIALMVWAGIFALLAFLCWRLFPYAPQFGVWLRQKMGGSLSPRTVTRGADWLIVLFMSVVMPAVWLPVASTIATFGLQIGRIKHSLAVLRRLLYWLWLCLLLVIGAYLPYRLVWWIPRFETVRAQAWSMGLRFFTAYCLAATAWVVLMWMVGIFVERED
jgi:hypothetical protein